jgi:carbon storage regulator
VIVLPRKPGESVLIGEDIVLTVVEVRGDKVRLAIELPSHMTLHRKEVHDALNVPRPGPVSPELG